MLFLVLFGIRAVFAKVFYNSFLFVDETHIVEWAKLTSIEVRALCDCWIDPKIAFHDLLIGVDGDLFHPVSDVGELLIVFGLRVFST